MMMMMMIDLNHLLSVEDLSHVARVMDRSCHSLNII